MYTCMRYSILDVRCNLTTMWHSTTCQVQLVWTEPPRLSLLPHTRPHHVDFRLDRFFTRLDLTTWNGPLIRHHIYSTILACFVSIFTGRLGILALCQGRDREPPGKGPSPTILAHRWLEPRSGSPLHVSPPPRYSLPVFINTDRLAIS